MESINSIFFDPNLRVTLPINKIFMAKKSFRELLYFNEVKVANGPSQELNESSYTNPIKLESDESTKMISLGKIDIPESSQSVSTNLDYNNLEIYKLSENSNTVIGSNQIKLPEKIDSSDSVTDSFKYIKLSKMNQTIDKLNYMNSKTLSGTDKVLDNSNYKKFKELEYHTGRYHNGLDTKNYDSPLAPVYKVIDDVLKKINASRRIANDISKVAKMYNLTKLQGTSDNMSKILGDSSNVVRCINAITREHVEPIVVNGKNEITDRGIDFINAGMKKLLSPEDKSKSLYKLVYTDNQSYDLVNVVIDQYSKKTSDSEYNKIGKNLKNYFKAMVPDASENSSITASGLSTGTLKAVTSKTLDTIFSYSDNQLGRIFTQFEENLKNEERLKYNTKHTDYYKLITSPYNDDHQVASPYEALQYACNNLGFSKGYHSYSGFSLGSDGIWSMTIEPYESNFGIKSLAPELPKLTIPVWRSTVTEGNDKPQLEYKIFDFGKTPPVMSYQINWATSRSKKIDLANESSISIPLGLSYNPTITINFIDDEHHSMRNYMGLYFNTIYKPDKGLMAPYDLASFTVTITSFKPGLKVNFMFKLICVPIDYALSYEGSETHTGSTVTVTMSIVGMKTPGNMKGSVDPTVDAWKDVSWKDITVVPCNYGEMTTAGNSSHLVTNRSTGGQTIVVNGG